MDRKVRVAQYGCGKMSAWLMRYALDKGADLVAAFDMDPNKIGKDVSIVIGGDDIGVKISDAKDAEKIMKELKVDVCVCATRSTVAELEPAFTAASNAGADAISTCEESLYPWNSSPEVTARLDALAKKNGTTITGYGIALAEGHGAGLTTEQFEAEIGKYNDCSSEEQQKLVESGELVPSYMWNQNGWLCKRLGLTPISQIQKCIPKTNTKDLKSETLGMTIPAGQPTGMRAIVTTETKEGITIETECIGNVYDETEFDINDWKLYGEPDISIKVDEPPTVELTCANIINRIPQLIDAPAGYVSTDQYPDHEYRLKPLNEYVKTK